MKFTPASPEDRSFPVAPDGTYLATVVTATEKVSSSGNPMITLKLHVLHPTTGETVIVFDHLVGTESSVWKIESFCKSAGLVAKYEAGDLQAIDCEGVEVQVVLTHEESAQFGVRNKVAKYVGTPYSRAA